MAFFRRSLRGHPAQRRHSCYAERCIPRSGHADRWHCRTFPGRSAELGLRSSSHRGATNRSTGSHRDGLQGKRSWTEPGKRRQWSFRYGDHSDDNETLQPVARPSQSCL